MTRTLTLSTGSFDQINTFNLVVPGFRAERTITCSLHRDYEKAGDGVFWAMKHGACVKASYSVADRAESNRLGAEAPVRPGDTVEIDGARYTVRVLGDYSNAAIFDPA